MNKSHNYLAAMLVILSLAWSIPTIAQTIYVSTSGNDITGTGSSSKPFASLAKAQSFIETSSCGTRSQPATIEIGQGTYYLLYSATNPGTLVFTCKDSGTSADAVTWQPNPANTTAVVVSGAIQVGGTSGSTGLGLTWTLTSGYSNIYQVTLPATYSNNNPTSHLTYNLQPFEYLYYQTSGSTTPSRRLRARIEQSDGVGYYTSGTNCISTQTGLTVLKSFCNLGTYLRVAGVDTNLSDCPNPMSGTPNNDGIKCLDRFSYTTSGPDQIMNWANLNGSYNSTTVGVGFGGPCKMTTGSAYPEGDIGLTLIDAWTVDAMRIACVDTSGAIIYLTGPTKANPGLPALFGPNVGHRYYIENARDAFFAAQAAGQTGLWYWDRSTSILYYIKSSGENLATDTVLIPQLPYSSVVASGQQLSNQFPQTSGGTPTGDFVGGSLLWAQAPAAGQTGLSYVSFHGITFQMDDFVPSFTGFNNDNNGDLAVPQAIDCESCQNVLFGSVAVEHTSGSGILIASPPANVTTTAAATADTVQYSAFMDIGDTGIRLGHKAANGDLATYVVNNIMVYQNLVDGYSRVFADGEGIGEGNGQGNTISYNDVTDGYHAGISICQESCGPFIGVAGVNGSNITTTFNRLWNMNQGVTSDGGSLYYNVGNTGGSGTGDVISNNIVHNNTSSSIIDGFLVIPGTGYGGNGIYLDNYSGGVTVENNVVYNMSEFAVSITSGPSVTLASNPHTFKNNIFSLAMQGMMYEQNPWQQKSCPTTLPFTTAKFLWNIWNFDLNENTPPSSGNTGGFSVVGGCANSCGQDYYRFQDFEANSYYRANTSNTHFPTFCSDPYAFHVLKSPVSYSCPSVYNTTNSNFLTFDSAPLSLTWQQGTNPVVIDEDDGMGPNTPDLGNCNWNPNFGTTGNPSDYTLSAGPPLNPFDYTQTNLTITSAGRTGQPTPPTLMETLPTYSYPNSAF